MLRAKSQELALTVHHRSDPGRVRDHNEDYLGYRQPEDPALCAEAGRLYAVADGVGGAQAGEVASRLTIQTLLAVYYHSTQETPAGRLREAFAAANRAVYEQASQQASNYRMSTTLVAAAIRGQELTVANVGDSRAYLIRDGQMRQISRDHSVVAQLVAKGVLTPEQAENHPQRHVISRGIGTYPDVQVDIFTETFLPGDRLLLCSDGLTEHLADADILAALQEEDPEAGVQRLVDQANERGGSDNITVLVVCALRAQDGQPASTLPRERKAAPLARRPSRLWIGIVALGVLICIAVLAAGAITLLNPTPAPTPTATATPLPPAVAPTATVTIIPTATSLPTETPSPTAAPSATATETTSPTVTASPTATPTSEPTAAPSPTPTPTDTTEFSPLPTPTGTTESSPLPTPPA